MRTLKQKKRNRLLAALLAVAMMFQMLPVLAFAAEDKPLEPGQARIVGGDTYNSVKDAVAAAPEGATTTIELGEGKYSLGNTEETEKVTSKSLIFVGAGTDKTTWQIRAPQVKHGGDGWCDYSFQNSDSITFQDMTVVGSVYPDGTTRIDNTQGLAYINHITLKDCVFNGRADYWGYVSTTFDNVTFNAPGTAESGISNTDYSVWTYTGKTYTFKDCTFNSTGKTINVYRNASSEDGSDSGSYNNVTVYFENCTVNSIDAEEVSKFAKTALNINDSNRGDYKYIINISGDNKVTAAVDKTTCSRVFGFGGKAKELIENSNSGRTEVYVNGKHVWGKKDDVQKGELKTHECSAGEAEHKVTTEKTEWKTVDARNDVRNVTRTCEYCGWNETSRELASVYRLQYDLNGGTGAAGANYDDAFYHEKESVALAAAPSCEGYDFVCWKDAAGRTYSAEEEIVLQGDTVLTAQWGKEPPEKSAESGESGCGVVSTVLIATGATAIGYYAGTQVLKHCYGLPYWPGNRSALALMLWEDADRPMPVSTVLYPDVGQKERDMDLQHAARWAMENELIPDLNLDDSKPEEEQKFFPNYAVSRAWALHAWNKAQKLKKNA